MIKVEEGIWNWHNDPRAIFRNNMTITGWIDMMGNVYAWSYNHTSGDIQEKLLRTIEKDDHGNPAFTILPDERILASFSYHGGANYIMVTNNSLDISAWGTAQTIETNGATYANPYYLSDEDLVYIFYRYDDYRQNFATYNYTSGVISSPTTIINFSTWKPYLKAFSNNKDKVYFLFSEGNPNRLADNDVFFRKIGKSSFM